MGKGAGCGASPEAVEPPTQWAKKTYKAPAPAVVAEKPKEEAVKPIKEAPAPAPAAVEVKETPAPAPAVEEAKKVQAPSRATKILSWLGATPEPGLPVSEALNTHFPGSLPGIAVLKRTTAVLKSKYDMDGDNTIYGQSICPDEINNEKGDLADIMKEYWGEVFPMGGIGGAPYVGKTGFGAFSHHVPDDGHVFILFGPHVGISESGEVGKYHRIGQATESGSCGAILAGYAQCCSGDSFGFDMDDMQQSYLRSAIAPRCEECKSAANPIAAVTHAAYDSIKDKMLRIVNTKFGPGKLVLLGGIQINMPAPYEDHFMPKFFQVMQEGEEPVDLLSELVFV